jgi:hypothetical protein
MRKQYSWGIWVPASPAKWGIKKSENNLVDRIFSPALKLPGAKGSETDEKWAFGGSA